MAASEIEKLERRYAENPHGLTFAPLAEVHRKNGDAARALELLTAGLELHPNYIPASIVLGRCHQDLGDLPAAEAAFAHVLRLDDENVIALKSLADINERLERFDDAGNWLRRLVAVDRSNEEAREQLRRVEMLMNSDRGAEPSDAGAQRKADSQKRPERPSAEVAALDLPPVDLAALDVPEPPPVALPRSPAAPKPERSPELAEKAPEVPPMTEARPPVVADSVPPMPGLISQEFEPPREPIRTSGEFLKIDVETSEEVVLEGSGGSEYRVPDAAEEFREAAWVRSLPPVPRAPEPVMETSPESPASPSYVARDTKGQSIASFFRTMLAARPPADQGSPGTQPRAAEGGSSRPAQDGLSLEPILGSDNSGVPPARTGSEGKGEAEVSFDDFFNPKVEGSAAEKNADPGNDDLDQFQTWLENLKR
jgi:hypothetical protein